MRRTHVLVAGGLALLTADPVAAQDLKRPANLFEQKKPAPTPPLVDWNWRPPAAASNAQATPTVICGMTMIPADPRVDPKMKVAAEERGTIFTMRVVPPTVCKAP